MPTDPALDISRCVTDDDYEAWRQVRIAVLPYERTISVAELRESDSPDRLMVLARRDGVVVGHGLSDRSSMAGGGSVTPRVLPEHRRRGVGTALLEHLVEHVRTLGVETLRAGADDEGSLAFAHRFGFAEVNREVEQTFHLDGPVEPTPTPDGIEVVTAQERPGLWDAAYERFGLEVLADFAVDTPLDVTRENWTREWLVDPMFLALADGEVVGCAGLGLDPDQPTRAENGLTAVRRDWRSRGLAVHLKQRTLAWGAEHGLTEVYTWTQDGNAAMRALNTRLGYATTRVGIQLARPLHQD